MKRSKAEVTEEIESLRQVIGILRKRRYLLEEQLATQGIQARPQLKIEIDSLIDQIKICEEEITELESSVADGFAPLMRTDKTSLPIEFELDFMQRRAILSEGQTKILIFIERQDNSQYVSQDIIEVNFEQYSRSELYYRLEHLRFLGFVEKEKGSYDQSGTVRFLYRLAPSYREKLGNYRSYHHYDVKPANAIWDSAAKKYVQIDFPPKEK